MQRFERHQSIYRLQAKDPIGTVKPGEVFVAEMMNAFGKRFRRLDEFVVFMQSEEKKKINHPSTGPIHVEGIGRDASVVIHLRRLVAENAMSCISKSTGFMRGDFEGRQPKIFDVTEEGYALMHGLLVRSDASVGLLATLDDQDHSPGRCTENGGNIDIPYLNEGSSIYLPVNHQEALIAIGDLHFRQGFGEASGMGIEADGEAEMMVEACDKIPYPVIDNHAYLSIIGWGPTQKEAQERAVRNAIDYLKRLPAFRLWSNADIYQFLGGFGLVPGNSTGNVTTFAQTIRKQDVLDPVARQTVILPPRMKQGMEETVQQKENSRLLNDAIQRYESLSVFHSGDSREIRSLPERSDLLVAKLQPRIYSFEANGSIDAPGTEAVRAKINAYLCSILDAAGLRTTTLATQDVFILMRKENVASRIEAVFKTRFSGSPKHRYKDLPEVPTRTGDTIAVNESHPPYIRFDWRNSPPDEDQVLPDGLADQFVDVQAARQTVMTAYEALKQHLHPRNLELLDGCFFLSQDGRVICAEVSCDNMRFAYRGHNLTHQNIFNEKTKDNVLRKWALIHELLTCMK